MFLITEWRKHMNTFVRLYNKRPAGLNGLAQHHPAFGSPAELDDLFAGFFRPHASAETATAEMRLDVIENEQAYIVSAAIAGAKKEDIQLDVDKNTISISVDIKRETASQENAEGARALQSERLFGKATRRFSVATEIDEAAVEAKYADGILTLTLPKKAPPQAKRINIS
jgi:HSP20 family protein